MKILITSSYKPDSETGTSQVTQELAHALSKKNKVLYLCLGQKLDTIKINKNLSYLTIPSIDLGKVSIPLITPLIVSRLEKIFDEFRPVVVHAQNSILTSKITQKWANENNVPFVVTFHHIPTQPIEHILPKLSKNTITKLAQEFYTQTSLKNFLSKTNAVIALNDPVYKAIKKIDKNILVKIINNGLNLSKFHKLKTNSPGKNKIRFIFLGSYIQRKNQEFLIKVFSKLPENYVLNCYGNKKTGIEYYTKLTKLIKKTKLKNIFLNDYVKKELISRIINKSDYFVSASVKEAQSLAIIQALASGKPLIGLENETLQEFKKKNVGVILPRNTSYLKFAIQLKTFHENIDYKKMSIKCRRESKRFDIKKISLQTEDFYKKIISDN